MKTHRHTAVNKGIKIPEIIIWLLALLVFTSLLFGSGLNAQTLDEFKQDTIWMRSGQIIPCKISREYTTEKLITLWHRELD